ncbi:MAG: hypothetical protein CM1200mP3_05200 [Chloroflexota bacterium]|nr:MAG: hypothetical protein CM1200mP3_05200 [Chloroflexota bacterium]
MIQSTNKKAGGSLENTSTMIDTFYFLLVPALDVEKGTLTGDEDMYGVRIVCVMCGAQQRPREIASQSYKYKRDSYCHT